MPNVYLLLPIVGGSLVVAIVFRIIIQQVRLCKVRKQVEQVEMIKQYDEELASLSLTLMEARGVFKNTPLPNTDIQSINGWLDQVHDKHHG